MRKSLAAAALVGALVAMTGCSSGSEPARSSGSPSRSVTAQPTASSSSSASSGSGPAAGDLSDKEACERFNELIAQYGAVDGDPNGYEDVYLEAQQAKDAVSGDLSGLFAALSLLAIDHSIAAEHDGQPSQESQDAVRDAVFANAGTCTAAGVTLRL